MPTFPTSALLGGFLWLAVTAAPAAPPPAPSRPTKPEVLDHKILHDQYNEGNFDVVIASFEGFIGRNKFYSHEDSVFIAKHLAVVYTANPSTREKGRYYMHQLLELMPSAKLVDMYVSEEIDRIFDKVREEFMAHQRDAGADSLRASSPRPAVEPSRGPSGAAAAAAPRKKPFYIGYWTAGGIAVVATGLTAAYIIHQGEEVPDRNYHVPRQ